jgi:DNA gyrase subunit A
MIITKHGILIRVPVSGVSEQGRATQGVRLIRVEDEDEVAAVAHVARDEEVPVVLEGDAGDTGDGDANGALDEDTSVDADAPESEES